jgi:hypothetical protein
MMLVDVQEIFMFDRQKAIQELVDNDFSDIFNLGQSAGEMLESILLNGFKGYDNFTDEELIRELNERLIAQEHDGQPDEAQEWHDFDPDC